MSIKLTLSVHVLCDSLRSLVNQLNQIRMLNNTLKKALETTILVVANLLGPTNPLTNYLTLSNLMDILAVVNNWI